MYTFYIHAFFIQMKTINLTSIVTMGNKFDLEFAFVENKIWERVEAYLNSYSAPHYTWLQDTFFYRCWEANFEELEKFANESFDMRYEDFCWKWIKRDEDFDKLRDAINDHANHEVIDDLKLRVIENTLNDENCVVDRTTVASCLDVVIQGIIDTRD